MGIGRADINKNKTEKTGISQSCVTLVNLQKALKLKKELENTVSCSGSW